jgi:hypothetical protein
MTWNSVRIATSFDYPPVPFREMDWAAWLDGHEEGRVGYGASRDIAIADLLQQLYEESL